MNVIRVILVLCVFSSLAFAMEISEGVEIGSGNTTYNITQNITLDSLNISDNCLFVNGGGFNDTYCYGNITYQFPTTDFDKYLINYTEPEEINISEGENLTFEVEPEGSYSWARWFLNKVKQTVGTAYVYISTYLSSETTPDDVTFYMRSDDGNITSKSWIINIENVNLAPEILYFEQSPDTLNWNENITAYCSAEDEDDTESELNATIEYRLPGSSSWVEVNTTYNGTDHVSIIETEYNPQHIGDWDFRCRVQDLNSTYSSYQTDFDSVTVLETYIPPTDPTGLSSQIKADIYLSMECQGSYMYNTNSSYYTFQIKQNTSTGWLRNITHINSSSLTVYTGKYPENTTLDLRCKRTNDAGSTAWVYSNDSVKITHGETTHIFYDGVFSDLREDEIIPFSVYTTESQDNQYIRMQYADCNEDGIWDYTFKFVNESIGINPKLNSSTQGFSCKYSQPGNYTLRAGAIFERINESKPWTGNCKGISYDSKYCQYERERGVIINENPIND